MNDIYSTQAERLYLRKKFKGKVHMILQKKEIDGMTNAQFDKFLEILAKLVEVTAKNPSEAASIIRSAKTTEE